METPMIGRKMLASLARIALPMMAATAVVAGQGTKPPSRPPSLPPQQQGTIFKAAANYVSRDVRVRDSRGVFVPNLKKSEFQIFEDGVAQEIAWFEPIIGGRSLGQSVAPVTAPTSDGLILPPSRPPPDTSGRIFVIFLDDLHLQANQTSEVRALMDKIRTTLLHDGDLITIVSTGPSSIEINPTYDLARMTEAKSKIIGSAPTPHDVIYMPESAQGNQLLRYNVQTAFRTAYDLLKQMESITNRRKAFIYISSGYDFNPFKDSRLQHEEQLYAMPQNCPTTTCGSYTPGIANSSGTTDTSWQNPFENQGQQFAESDLIRELVELTKAANRANTSFYTIDPRGLMPGMSDIGDQLTAEEYRSYVDTTISSLRVLADETGGMAVVNQNDFIKALKEIDNATSDYYMLGYYSTNPDPLHPVRKIEIKVSRPGVELNYQTTYSIRGRGKTP
jgi:VWFA-related protein